VAKSVRTFFTTILSESKARDTVIITCDAREQLRGLKECMVDVDGWEIGLCTLFDPDAPAFGEEKMRNSVRSRSRSPGPSHRTTRDSRQSSQRYQPSSSRSSHSIRPTRQGNRHRYSVHVVDVIDLWEILPDVPLVSHDALSELRKMALKLRLHCDLHSWSAGNDAKLLYKIWGSLCGGAPIDSRGADVLAFENSAQSTSKGAHQSRSLSREVKPLEEDDGGPAGHDDLEKSGKSNLEYAFGVGPVQDAVPKAKTPEYDPYDDFESGFDAYDDD